MKITDATTFNDTPQPSDKLLATVEVSTGVFALRQLTLANVRLTGPPGRNAVGPGPRLPFTGDTSDGATWQRVVKNGSQPCYTLSSFATATRYKALTFTVPTAGSYTITITPDAWEAFLAVYTDTFDPGNPFAGFPLANDSTVDLGPVSITMSLLANIPYVAVATGYENGDCGPFTLDVSGPGVASLQGTGQLFYCGGIPFASQLEVDMQGDYFGQLSLAGDVELATVNRAAGLVREIFIAADGTERALTFPSGWLWLGMIPPTVAANGRGLLRLVCLGAAESDVVAQWIQ